MMRDVYIDDLGDAPLAQLLALCDYVLDGEDLIGRDGMERARIEHTLRVRQTEAARILVAWPTCPECGAYLNDDGECNEQCGSISE
jgi:hypothetical protein